MRLPEKAAGFVRGRKKRKQGKKHTEDPCSVMGVRIFFNEDTISWNFGCYFFGRVCLPLKTGCFGIPGPWALKAS